MYQSPHLALTKLYWKHLLVPGDTVIDATCGNGYDTLFLAQFPLSSLVAIDIQEAAINNTRALLEKNLTGPALQKIILLRISHETLNLLPLNAAPRLIVYNLGYLPGGDKMITTRAESTLTSLAAALSLLGKQGAISITCYPRHEEGQREESALLAFSAALPNTWEVRHHRWLNKPLSPSLLWISNDPS